MSLPYLRAGRYTLRTVQFLTAYHVFVEAIAEPQICTGYSMLPTLSHDGDMVLASPLAYWRPAWLGGWPHARPERGDLVIMTNPLDPSYPVCKRVIGIEGDTIEVDPRRSSRSWSSEESSEERKGAGHFVRIPKAHIWVVGDNLSNSNDSRIYGPVPIAMVRGKAIARIWSNGLPRWQRLDSHRSELGPSPTPDPTKTTTRL